MNLYFFLVFHAFLLSFYCSSGGSTTVESQTKRKNQSKNLPFLLMSHLDKNQDTMEFWRETQMLSLVEKAQNEIDFEQCDAADDVTSQLRIPSSRTVQAVCRSESDYQLCPQCARFNNKTICDLFRDTCTERRVSESEHRSYCDKKYGPHRAMFLPADPARCHCCDECIFFRELDQSCIADEYYFESEEFLPVTTVDFRAGCNPYWGHPEQDTRALRCDKTLRRCVPVNVPAVSSVAIQHRRDFRFQSPVNESDCPINCAGYFCPSSMVREDDCEMGAFLPDKKRCNCCGKCSYYKQLNQKCAIIKKKVVNLNGTEQIEVEEEFLDPGCDDGMVCRQGRCQNIHAVMPTRVTRREMERPYEPCKNELRYFKKKYGPEGHLHYEAPQCTPLWLYSAVQCRRFVCYCAMEDGTRIEGIHVPRAEVSSMICDCARQKCHTGSDIECDGYGNYKEAIFPKLKTLKNLIVQAT